MRRLALLSVLLLAPLVAAGTTTDTRDVVVNEVLDPRCPGYGSPATIGCFAVPAGATQASIVARPTGGDAQPRMVVQLQNATVLWSIHGLCDDRTLGWGAENVTLVVVSLHADRAGCGDGRMPVLASGTLSASFP